MSDILLLPIMCVLALSAIVGLDVRGRRFYYTLAFVVALSLAILYFYPAALLPLLAIISALIIYLIGMMPFSLDRRLVAVRSYYAAVLLIVLSFLFFAIKVVLFPEELAYSTMYYRVGQPWYYGVASLWAGPAGSLFVLLTIAAVYGAYNAVKRDLKWVSLWSLVLVAFAVALYFNHPFAPAETGAMGFGLPPSLRSPWMAVHIFPVFLGYAAALDAFLVALIWRNGRLASPLTVSTLSLATGIVLGACWAYETSGYGGYWSWDPVENFSLAALLIALAGSVSRNRRWYALSIFPAATATMAAARSGVLPSIHAYASADVSAYAVYAVILASAAPTLYAALVSFKRDDRISASLALIAFLIIVLTPVVSWSPISWDYRILAILAVLMFYSSGGITRSGLFLAIPSAVIPLLLYEGDPLYTVLASAALFATALAAGRGLALPSGGKDYPYTMPAIAFSAIRSIAPAVVPASVLLPFAHRGRGRSVALAVAILAFSVIVTLHPYTQTAHDVVVYDGSDVTLPSGAVARYVNGTLYIDGERTDYARTVTTISGDYSYQPHGWGKDSVTVAYTYVPLAWLIYPAFSAILYSLASWNYAIYQGDGKEDNGPEDKAVGKGRD